MVLGEVDRKQEGETDNRWVEVFRINPHQVSLCFLYLIFMTVPPGRS